MLSSYPACFFKDESGYSVIFPDLNWLATCGETLEEALAMAIDCLAGYLYSAQRENSEIPAASSLSSLNPASVAQELDLTPSEMFANLVSVDVSEYAKNHFEKAVKKTLTIPAWLNKAALANDINFSQVLQEALMAKLHLHK